MGIWSLTTFMSKIVPNGLEDVSIIDECRKYSENNEGQKPTLIFDFLGLQPLVNEDIVDMLYGGSQRAYFKKVDKIFRALSEIADLVFFQDGPIADEKEATFIDRGNNHYKLVIAMIDKVNQKIPIIEILRNWELHQIPGNSAGLGVLAKLADEYGTFKVSLTKECDAEIAQFACNNPSTIAIIAEDSDFLIFPGKWRYFSIKHFDFEALTTKEYNRTALRSFLSLNDDQLPILSTMAGNDIVRYNEVSHCHGKKIGNLKHYKDVREKFLGIAQKIKTFDGWHFHGLISFLASFLLHDKSEESKQRIFESIDQYNIFFTPVDNKATTPLLKFCRMNDLDFTYSVLQKKALNLEVGSYDRRNPAPDFHSAFEKLNQRQIGIVLQHQKPALGKFVLDLYAKKSHDEPMQKHLTSPIYPDFEVPELIELIDRENFSKHDNVRFDILKWTVSDTLKDIDLAAIPQTYLRYVLTLHFMVAEGFIAKHDADIILLSVKDALANRNLEKFSYPPIVDPNAFQIAFLFLNTFTEMASSFEVAGLEDLSTSQAFEGGYFHGLCVIFSEAEKSPSAYLQDINDYRIYRNLPDISSALSSKVSITDAIDNLSLNL